LGDDEDGSMHETLRSEPVSAIMVLPDIERIIA
jgi:hypothetical protein